jgi:hypothetical protein
MFQYIWYNKSWVLFHGQALLDPSTLYLGTATSEPMAALITRALNDSLAKYDTIEICQYALMCASNQV